MVKDSLGFRESMRVRNLDHGTVATSPAISPY